jgi:predicted Zn finger-like uncharacterized protein
MIVACTACQARFRVADERIGPHGSRARCIRCGATFLIPPRAPAPTVEAAPPEEPSAFQEEPPAAPLPPFRGPSLQARDAVPPGPGATDAPPPPRPAEPPPERVPTGWTEAFEVAAESDPLPAPGPPAPAPDDPFAVAMQQATTPPPVPPAASDPFAAFGSAAMTDLADLERTGVRGLRPAGEETPAAPPPVTVTAPMTPAPGPLPVSLDGPGGLSLEERTPVAVPIPPRAPPVPGSMPDPEGLPEWGAAPGADRIVPMPLADFEFAPGPPVAGPPPLPAPRRAAPPPARSAPGPSGPAPAPVRAPVAPATPPRPAAISQGRVRALAVNAVALAVVLAVAAGIVLWWRGDDVARLVRRAGGGGGEVEVLEVVTGTYPTALGRPAVVVRGAVRSRSGGPVRVSAEMIRDGQVVGRSDGLAGATPSPDELAAVAGPEDLERLRATLARRAAERAPGAGALPFLLVFPEPVGDPSTVSFRVDAAPATP